MCNLTELDNKRKEEILANRFLETAIFLIIVFGLALVVVMVTPTQRWLIAALALAFVAMVVGFSALRLR